MDPEPKFSNHEKKQIKKYNVEILGALAVYGVVLVIAMMYGKPMTPGAARTALLLSPMVGFALMIWAIWRMLQRVDEYVRMKLLESIALAAAVTVGVTFTYGFMEIAGYPLLSMFSVWPLFGSAYLVASLTRLVRAR